MKVTLDILKAKRACADQVALFEQTFGEEVEVTLATCLQAQQAGIDLYWASENLFNKEQKAYFNEALKPIYAAYKEALKQIYAAYKEVLAEAFYTASQV